MTNNGNNSCNNTNNITLPTITTTSNGYITYTIVPAYPAECVQLDFAFTEPVEAAELNGYSCCSCKEHFPYAKSNLPEGKFKCYACKNGL